MMKSEQNRIEDLLNILESTSWSRNPEAASQKTLETITEVLACDLATIYLVDVTGEHLTAYATHDIFPFDGDFFRLPITTGRLQWMLSTHEPITMDFENPNPVDRMPRDSMGYKSAISVPLLVCDNTLGMLTLLYRTQKKYSSSEIEYFKNIGRLLGVIVQHAQTAIKTADLEILKERKRLCAEIHDNLSQMIGSLAMNSEAALLTLEEGDLVRLGKNLERIKCITQEVNQLLRDEMLSIRTPTNESEGLVSGIKESLTRFQNQWKINIKFHVEDGLEPLVVSTQVEMQLLRILHESLSNIARHATASSVSVHLYSKQNRLWVEIQDNGLGFDPDDVPSERLGLQIMHERASSLGGKLSIHSNKNAGTTVFVELPLFNSKIGECR